MVIPTLTYACKAWTLQARHKGQIETTQMRLLRRIERVTRLDRVRNVEFRGGYKQEGVLDMTKKWQQNWKRRVEEVSTKIRNKKIYNEEIPGSSRKRWRCNFD